MAKYLKKTKRSREEILLGILGVLAAALLLTIVLLYLPQPEEPPEDTLPEPVSLSEETEETEPPPPPLPPNRFGPRDFQYSGDYLVCLNSPSAIGIDVSDHQGEIDWEEVAAAGIQFAIIRIGFRGYGTGRLVPDSCWEENLDGAAAAGIKVGVYFFSQAVSVGEARSEARMVLSLLNGRELDLPVVYDWEYIGADTRTGDTTGSDVTDFAITFCDIVEEGGYDSMIYLYQNLSDLLRLEDLKGRKLWLAMYEDRMTYPYDITMWQYSCTGTVPGIAGDVDLDIYLP